MLPRPLIALCLALATTTPASSAQTLEGARIRASYNDLGVWNDHAKKAGLQVLHDDKWVEYTFPGTPYASWRLSWEDGGSAPEEYWVNSSVPDSNVVVLDEQDLSTEDVRSSRYIYQIGAVRMQKTEVWSNRDSTILMHFYIQNTDNRPLTDLTLLYAIDPDQDAGSVSHNDTVDVDEDGRAETVLSVGPLTGHTIAFGSCEQDFSEVGHFATWRNPHNAHVKLTDNEAVSGDWAMAIRIFVDGTLAPQETAMVSFLVSVGDTAELALTELAASQDRCSSCDADADGWLAVDCGDSDCNDNDASVNPDQAEIWYDGVDSDCDYQSDFDADGDGFDSDEHNDGDDCDDTDPEINPEADDAPYDGVDADCAGDSDLDADGDGYDSGGHGGDDCDDADAEVHPGAADAEGDNKDSDCNGLDGPAAELVNGPCGCSAGSSGAGWIGVFGLALALRRRRIR